MSLNYLELNFGEEKESENITQLVFTLLLLITLRSGIMIYINMNSRIYSLYRPDLISRAKKG